MRVTVEDYPVLNKYFYIVNFSNLLNVKLLASYFVNRKAAKRAIKTNIPKRRCKFYEVRSGMEVKKFFMTYQMGSKLNSFTKYIYTEQQKSSMAEKKNHRTMMRRRLRRMNLLTLVKPRLHIKKKAKNIKPIKNTQWIVARGNKKMNSAAKVLQVERKADYYYYLIIKHTLSSKRAYLFEIDTLRFNKKTGAFKRVLLKTKSNDILIPYLIDDLNKLVYEKIQAGIKPREYYSGFGFSILENKRK